MCCKDEQGRDRVMIPLGVGYNPEEMSKQLELIRWDQKIISHEEAALRFKAWLSNKVCGGFYEALRRAL